MITIKAEDLDKLLDDRAKKREEDKNNVIEYIDAYLNTRYKLYSDNNVKTINEFLKYISSNFNDELTSIKSIDRCYDMALSHKDDIFLMLKICMDQINDMIENGSEPAPFYFERVAILARKRKDYQLEVNICNVYVNSIELLMDAHKENNTLLYLEIKKGNINIRARYDKILARFPKAKQLLEKSKNKLD